MKISEQYNLKGKVAIITGAGDGIGRALSLIHISEPTRPY